MKLRALGVVSFFAAATLFVVGFLETRPLPLAPPTNDRHTPAQVVASSSAPLGGRGLFSEVTRVIDGDTFVAKVGGKETTVRLIGLDTPETVDPRKPVECFGKEASDEAKRVLSGKSVRLVEDPTQGARDLYGRLLAYAYLPDGTLFNKLMIAEGYGREYTFHTPYEMQGAFKAAEVDAKRAGAGLWSASTCNGDTGPGSIPKKALY